MPGDSACHRSPACMLAALMACGVALFLGVWLDLATAPFAAQLQLPGGHTLRTAAPASPRSSSQQPVLPLRDRRGLYRSGSSAPAWAAAYDNVVLVTAANYAYREVLENWECAAASLGLQWVVVAMDQEMYEHLGAERAVLTGRTQVSGTQTFRKGGFNVMSCSKLAAVGTFLKEGADVVFMDPDNVFVKDPFRPGEELGGLMLQGIDYVYSTNLPVQLWWPDPARPSSRGLMQCSAGSMEIEGNTGLYFIRAKTSRGEDPNLPGSGLSTRSLFRAAVSECSRQPDSDDQTVFWQVLKNVKQRSHCTKQYSLDGTVKVTVPRQRITTCCLDPRSYASGMLETNPSLLTYHANFVTGLAPKIKKLREVTPAPGLWLVANRTGTEGTEGDTCSSRKLGALMAAAGQDTLAQQRTRYPYRPREEIRWDRQRDFFAAQGRLVLCQCDCGLKSGTVFANACAECEAGCVLSFTTRAHSRVCATTCTAVGVGGGISSSAGGALAIVALLVICSGLAFHGLYLRTRTPTPAQDHGSRAEWGGERDAMPGAQQGRGSDEY